MSESSVSQAFKTHEVVPDVLAIAPENLLKVVYADNVNINLGNEVKPVQVKDIPISIDFEADENAFYTLCLTDPDAPSRKNPVSREWHHWLVVNIKGKNLKSGTTISAYVGSGPPKNSGLHRYVFLVYKQPCLLNKNFKILPNDSVKGRDKFKISIFAKEHNLGEPLFGNFFQAQWDDYVPILYSQFKD